MDDRKHLINREKSLREALVCLEQLSTDAILFVVDHQDKLLGSLTDGDIRRGIIRGLDAGSDIMEFVNANPKAIRRGNFDLGEIIELRARNILIFPVVDSDGVIMQIVNFRTQRSYLPVDALIMAGGRGIRLRPLTDGTPKPLLPVCGKPILEYNIDRLASFGVDDIWISIRYLGEQIQSSVGDGADRGMHINYVWEEYPLGTAGALSLVDGFVHETILLMNSDILTNIDYEKFYLFFKEHEADLAVACIPYQVKVPYAVMETQDQVVSGFREKPTYTHYSNAGIYLMKTEVLPLVPGNKSFDATDLMENLIASGKKVVAFPLLGYWLDIGNPQDYEKAQTDCLQIKW